MSSNEILSKVTGILDNKGFYNAKPEDRFVDDLGLDSLDVVEIIMECERDFNVEIPDEDADKIKTVGQVVDYLEKKLSEPAAQQ